MLAGSGSGAEGGSAPVSSKKISKKASADNNKPIPEPAERKTKPVQQVLCEFDELQDGQ